MCSKRTNIAKYVLIVFIVLIDCYVAAESGLCVKSITGAVYETPKFINIWPPLTDSKYVCCPGYERNIDYKNWLFCVPVCKEQCRNGYCNSPNECKCKKGYEKNVTNKYKCLPTCNPSCGPGQCIKPNQCICDLPYVFRNNTCELGCSSQCLNSVCVGPENCQCYPGYKKINNYECETQCSNGCTHGSCVGPNNCICNKGWKSSNDDGVCQPVCDQQCVNAICKKPNTCECLTGYKIATKLNICEPHCSTGCTNGTCVSPDTCICDKGWIYSSVDGRCKPVCEPDCINGTCIAPDTCECLTGYQKCNRSTNACEPYCSNNCSQGICISPEVRLCSSDLYWNNITKTCDANYTSTPDNLKGWSEQNWQYVVSAVAVALTAVAVIAYCIIFCQNKGRQNDAHNMMTIPGERIRMNIFRRAKIYT